MNQLKIFLFLLLTISSATPFECPVDEEIDPCKCFLIEDSRAFLICEGPLVSQEAINNLFDLIKSRNKMVPLIIDEFRLTGTVLRVLDVTPFSDCFFSSFDAHGNENLEQLAIGSSSNFTDDNGNEEDDDEASDFLSGFENFEENYTPFWADVLNFEVCAFTDKSLANLHLLINPESVRYLKLSSNKIEGPIPVVANGNKKGEKEFFSGLSKFSQLTQLLLRYNRIGSLGSGQFKNNTRLAVLDLQNNLIGQVDENAFLFNPPSVDMTQIELMISLYGNKLNDSTFSATSGLASIGRPIILDLEYNSFHSISRPHFENYLLDQGAGDRNQFWGTGNFWFCDNSMKWIKDAKSRLEARVTGIYCSNDPGQTVFTSSLID